MCHKGFLQGFDLKSMLFNIFVTEETKKNKITETVYEWHKSFHNGK